MSEILEKNGFSVCEYYTPKEIVITLGVGKNAVYGWVDSGLLVAKRVGGRLRVYPDALESFLSPDF